MREVLSTYPNVLSPLSTYTVVVTRKFHIGMSAASLQLYFFL